MQFFAINQLVLYYYLGLTYNNFQNCQWSTWTNWSECSQTCGTGQKIRTRSIANPAEFGGIQCQDKDGTESENCVILSCPVDGQWGNWSKWSYCNVTCGQGHKSRTRECNNPAPENGGFNCIGDNVEVTKCEALRKCSMINGGWSAWTRWSG